MTQELLFTVAGTSTLNGETKVRFANDLVSRIKTLNRSGHTNINIIELPKAMTKLEAAQYLQTQEGFTSGDAGFAVATKVAEKTKIAKKGEVKVAGASLKASAKATKVAV